MQKVYNNDDFCNYMFVALVAAANGLPVLAVSNPQRDSAKHPGKALGGKLGAGFKMYDPFDPAKQRAAHSLAVGENITNREGHQRTYLTARALKSTHNRSPRQRIGC